MGVKASFLVIRKGYLSEKPAADPRLSISREPLPPSEAVDPRKYHLPGHVLKEITFGFGTALLDFILCIKI